MTTVATGHHLVDVTVNGVAGTFLVDTGAGASVVHLPHLQRFGLVAAPDARQGEAIGAGGASAASEIAVREVSVGGMRTSIRHVYSVDLGAALRVLEAGAGVEVQGIIGQDAMRAHHAIVDVAESRLYLRPADSSAAALDCSADG